MTLSISQGAQSIDNNTTNITLKASVISSGGSYNHYEEQTAGSRWILRKNNESGAIIASGNFKHIFNANTTTVVLSKSITCPHDSDGTLKVYAQVTYNCNTPSYPSVSATIGPITLKTIPRASKINTVTNPATLGSDIRITMSRYSDKFYHKALISVSGGGHSHSFTSAAFATSLTLSSTNVPISWADVAQTATSFSATITVTTYTNSAATTEVGSVSTTIKINIPNNESFKPVISGTITPTIDSDYEGYALRGISSAQISAPTVSCKYTTLNYITVNGKR